MLDQLGVGLFVLVLVTIAVRLRSIVSEKIYELRIDVITGSRSNCVRKAKPEKKIPGK